jgi:hypothetical protein
MLKMYVSLRHGVCHGLTYRCMPETHMQLLRRHREVFKKLIYSASQRVHC